MDHSPFLVPGFTYPTVTVIVDYEASDATATDGEDDVSARRTLDFAPGITSQAFSLSVKDDPIDEVDETAYLVLMNPSRAILSAPATVTLTIIDDDYPSSLSISDVSITKGNSGLKGAVFSVTLSLQSGKFITVEYATANDSAIAPIDHLPLSPTTLTFRPGITTQRVTVTIQGDIKYEPDERFWVKLGNAVNASLDDAQGQRIILNDDRPYILYLPLLMGCYPRSGTCGDEWHRKGQRYAQDHPL